MHFVTDLIYDYDSWFILILAIINVLLFIVAKYELKGGMRIVYPNGALRFRKAPDMMVDSNGVIEIMRKRNRIISLYTAYANCTAIFPLLGILGTVAALVTISDSIDMMNNLMVALDTTLYGILAAIVFKMFDSFISGPLDSFIDDADNIIHTFDEEKVKKDET